MAEWRSMKNAPKDGRHVLLSCDVDGPFVCEGYYEKDHGWWAANVHWTDAHGYELRPQRWMPLPKPYKAKEGDTP